MIKLRCSATSTLIRNSVFLPINVVIIKCAVYSLCWVIPNFLVICLEACTVKREDQRGPLINVAVAVAFSKQYILMYGALS